MKKIFLIGLTLLFVSCSNYQYRNVSCHLKTVEEDIHLSADALFHFDKTEEKDLLPKGKASLDNLVRQLNNGWVRIAKITLVGHTDRLGSDLYNQKLGLSRAKTVRHYLITHGINVPISVDSKGEMQPITNGCFNLPIGTQLRACLQPDRRVSVKVLGIKKMKKSVK